MPTLPERQSRRKRVSDAAMLDAARDAFVADGFDGAGMEAIAAAAATTKVTLYARYGSKQGLFQAALTREVDALQQRLVDAYDSERGGSPTEELVRYVAAYFDAARAEPRGFQLLFVDDSAPTAGQTVQPARAMLTARIASLLASFQRSRRASPEDALLAALIVGSVHFGAGAAVAAGADIAAAQRTTERFLRQALLAPLADRSEPQPTGA